MDHGRYCQPAFTAGDPRLHFHSPVPSLVSEVPFYMNQVLNPNAPPPPAAHTFLDTTSVSPPPPPPPPPTYSPQTGWNVFNGGINLNQGTGSYAQGTTIRWPRQETLTLLEIRSRLDHCFKEATSSNHKAPLWDEISRIMKEEYGYQRSGRKCKEKFENLYKYYKKTKEGKVGKTDGKHYRFFRQLEALVGNHHDPGSTNMNTAVYPSNQSNNSSGNTTPSDHHEFKKKEMIAAIEESVESHFMKLMVKQEQWCEKILCTIEQKEQERVMIENEWRKHEEARLDQEYEAWASHVAHIKTRDESLLEALQNLIKVRSVGSTHGDMDPMTNSKETECLSDPDKCKDWIEPEISSLIHIRTNKECKFQDVDQEHEDRLWQEVAFEMSLLGYDRSAKVCKETWDKLCVENTISREVSSGTSNPMNIECGRSWETM
ncbi:putative transcription factor MYB family [Helianthus annuus]|uniref:Transcription factor MYB family n=2 Tax=Helianthus annuus TaxID=4232 RepID=A0A9K3E5L7_HELAN|nr:trihelix transcription factor PTL [Helianthus annuus]KAF5766446.1 putative transcription factor MYB family [Helianthus annuus]KAJ0452826.1 putative transcription factor MYB family [Helianthus annuus]KAJ0457848.1 putative transcription factor MYB family [Helianthus annuus]KAJ0474741.1 putative transcription factor MYB family [Helianthus annuus]KAJ0650294.1 putative transcription factor MYB family [Helianthus annuus]